MKMKIFGLIGLAGLMGLAACDRIAPEEYTVPVGGDTPQEWRGQRVYVEKYTGPRCVNCPAADRTLEAAHGVFGDHLVVVSVNSKTEQFGAPYSGEPDMRTAVGGEWESYWGDNMSLPAAFINRTAEQYNGAMSNIVGGVQEVVYGEPSATVEVSAELDGQTVGIDVDVEVLKALSGTVNLSLIVVEDSVAYAQLDGGTRVEGYVHNHMLRDVVGGTWGWALDLEGTAGERLSLSRSYTFTNADIVPANCKIVALLTDAATKEVLNCAECRISDESW